MSGSQPFSLSSLRAQASQGVWLNDSDLCFDVTMCVKARRSTSAFSNVVVQGGNNAWVGSKSSTLSDDYVEKKLSVSGRKICSTRTKTPVEKYDPLVAFNDFNALLALQEKADAKREIPRDCKPVSVVLGSRAVPLQEHEIVLKASSEIIDVNVPTVKILESMLDLNNKEVKVYNDTGLRVNGMKVPMCEDIIGLRMVRLSPTHFIAHTILEKPQVIVNKMTSVAPDNNTEMRVPKRLEMKGLHELIAYPDVYFTPSKQWKVFGKFTVVRDKNEATLQFGGGVQFKYTVSATNNMSFLVALTKAGIIVVYSMLYLENRSVTFSEWLFWSKTLTFNDKFRIAQYQNIRHYNGGVAMLHYGFIDDVRLVGSNFRRGKPNIVFEGRTIAQSTSNTFMGYDGVPIPLLIKCLHHNADPRPNHLRLLNRPYNLDKSGLADYGYPDLRTITLDRRLLLLDYDYSSSDHVMYYLIHYGLWNSIKFYLRWVKAHVAFDYVQMDRLFMMMSLFECPRCSEKHSIKRDCKNDLRPMRYYDSTGSSQMMIEQRGVTVPYIFMEYLSLLGSLYLARKGKDKPTNSFFTYIDSMVNSTEVYMLEMKEFMTSVILDNFTVHREGDVLLKMREADLAYDLARWMLNQDDPSNKGGPPLEEGIEM